MSDYAFKRIRVGRNAEGVASVRPPPLATVRHTLTELHASGAYGTVPKLTMRSSLSLSMKHALLQLLNAPKSIKTLERELAASRREIVRAINELADEGYPVVGTSKGFVCAQSAEEMVAHSETMRKRGQSLLNRARDIRARAETLAAARPNFSTQFSLFHA